MNLLRRIRAFVIRDFQLALSYRFEFFIRIIWILGIVTTFFFISRIFAGNFVSGQYEQWQNPLAVGCRNLAVRFFPDSVFRKEQQKSHDFEI